MAPAECPTCGDTFDTEFGMKVHHGTVHGPMDDPTEGDYPCPWPDCDRAFDHELGVKTHHYRAHGESISDRPTKTCRVCGDEYEVKRANYERRKYCSYECSAIGRTTHVEKDCPQCGETFEVYPSTVDRRTFCSTECLFTAHSGQEHPNWRGGYSIYFGVRSLLPGPSWETLRERHLGDECETCGSTEDCLHLHHIVPIMFGGTNHPDNLMTVCEHCHPPAEAVLNDICEPVLVDFRYEWNFHHNELTA